LTFLAVRGVRRSGFHYSLIASTVTQGILLMTAHWLSNGRSPVCKGGAHQDLISGDVAAEP